MTGADDEFDRRARMAAAELRRAVEVHPPDIADLVSVARVTRAGRVALTLAVVAALGGAVLAIGAVSASPALRWSAGVVLVVLVAASWLLSAHAGGHAWFVPVPAVVVGIVWALTASTHSATVGWWLVAFSAAASGAGLVFATTALRQRVRGTVAVLAPVEGATGVAVTDLTPVGIVRVAGETWSAESFSGVLPAGAPVHVVKVRGVRLEVWSEMGTVPDAAVFDIEEDQP